MSSIDIFFFFNDTATTEIYTLSLHDALPIFLVLGVEPVHELEHNRPIPAREPVPETYLHRRPRIPRAARGRSPRSEEHTSELQSRQYLVCRLLLEKKNTHSITFLTLHSFSPL